MERDEALLDVHALAHLSGGANEDALLPPVHVLKKLQLFGVGVGLVDDGDLCAGNADGRELLQEVLIDVELPWFDGRWRAEIQKDELGQTVLRALPPNLHYLRHCRLDLGDLRLWSQWDAEPHVQCDMPPIAGHRQHVVVLSTDTTTTNRLGTSEQLFYIRLQVLGCRHGNECRFATSELRFGELQVFGELHVCYSAKHRQEFRDIAEAGEPGAGLIALASGRNLFRLDNLAKGVCPGVKMFEALDAEEVWLQKALERKEFGHRVGHRSPGGKDEAAPIVAGHDVAALDVEVKGAV